LTFRARLYGYGDKYLIPRLKRVTSQKFRDNLDRTLSHGIVDANFDKLPDVTPHPTATASSKMPWRALAQHTGGSYWKKEAFSKL
jgi:hypothetical protein